MGSLCSWAAAVLEYSPCGVWRSMSLRQGRKGLVLGTPLSQTATHAVSTLSSQVQTMKEITTTEKEIKLFHDEVLMSIK